MKAKIILNPYANRWNGAKKKSLIEDACREVGLDYDLYVLPSPGLGSFVSRAAAAEGYDVIVAAGGDGTVGEVLNGLISAAGEGPTIPMAVMPIGTGNDFSDMSHLPHDLTESARMISTGRTRQIDAGKLILDGTTYFFGNNCALAMEPMVTIENIYIKRLSGKIRYVVALIKALAKLNAWQFSFSWDGGHVEGPTLLLSVCNSPRTGGMFLMAPGASMEDGLFDFVWAPELPLRTILTLLPRLFNGSHIGHPQVQRMQTERLELFCPEGTPVHADGEVISILANRLVFEILPGKITLLTQ